ncbi:MAG: hypothetical protein CMO73_00295 [Verrucomicrobiales bacterium]|nr:hypothetical protein [Verrucomicrobiales bacterium]HAA87664.1 hypothetical protein [Verrucomicrobiales bacterium]|tara:strand:+ start:499 stop:1116 length:618 start_codon:yes stop_codon:yes gene_type:complete
MSALWESYLALDPPAMKTFVGIGAVSSCVLFIQMLFLLILGGDVDFDLGEVGEGGGTGIFSIRSIGSFFTGFGWTGAMLLEKGYSLGIATLGATVMGSLILAGFLAMMRWMHGFKSDGTINYANAVGNVGNVYVPIRPRRKGMGQIQVEVQGRLAVVAAVTDYHEKIENRTAVRVKELVDSRTLLVAPLELEVDEKKDLSPDKKE